MAKKKTFFGKLIATVIGIFGSVFSHVLKGAEKSYNELPPETQAALQHGSGVMDFINSQIGELPENVEAGILEKFPELDVESLQAGLRAVAKGFNLGIDEAGIFSIPELIAKIQAHFSSLQGGVWDGIINGAANILAFFLAPAGTKFGAITSLMEYVYQTFFRKKNK